MNSSFKHFYFQTAILSMFAVLTSIFILPEKDDMAADYYIDEQFQQAEVLLKELEEDKKLEEKDALSLAKVYLKKGENDKAIDILEELYKKYPKSLELEATLRNAYKHSQYTSIYLNHLETSLQKNPTVETYNELNLIYLNLKMLKKLRNNILSKHRFSSKDFSESETVMLLQAFTALHQPKKAVDLIRNSYKKNSLSKTYMANAVQICLDYNELSLCEKVIRHQLKLLRADEVRLPAFLVQITDILVTRNHPSLTLKILNKYGELTDKSPLLLKNKLIALITLFPEEKSFAYMSKLHADKRLPPETLNFLISSCIKHDKSDILLTVLKTIDIKKIEESLLYDLLCYCCINQHKSTADTIKRAFDTEELDLLPAVEAITSFCAGSITLAECSDHVKDNPFSTSSAILATVEIFLHYGQSEEAYNLLNQLFISEYTALDFFTVSYLIVMHGDTGSFEKKVLKDKTLSGKKFFQSLLSINKIGSSGVLDNNFINNKSNRFCKDLFYYLMRINQSENARTIAGEIYQREQTEENKKNLISALLSTHSYSEVLKLCLKNEMLENRFYLQSFLQSLAGMKNNFQTPSLKSEIVNRLNAYVKLIPKMKKQDVNDLTYALINLKEYNTATAIAREQAEGAAPFSDEVQLYLSLCRLTSSGQGRKWFKTKAFSTEQDQAEWLMNLYRLQMYEDVAEVKPKNADTAVVVSAALIAEANLEKSIKLVQSVSQPSPPFEILHLQNLIGLQLYQKASEFSMNISSEKLFEDLTTDELLRLSTAEKNVNHIKNIIAETGRQTAKAQKLKLCRKFLLPLQYKKAENTDNFLKSAEKDTLELLYFLTKDFNLKKHEKIVLTELSRRFPEKSYYIQLLNYRLREEKRTVTVEEANQLATTFYSQRKSKKIVPDLVREIGYLLSEIKPGAAADCFYELVKSNPAPPLSDLTQLAYLNSGVQVRKIRQWYGEQAKKAPFEKKDQWLNYLLQMNADELVEHIIEKERETYGY